jgi:arsenate reductase
VKTVLFVCTHNAGRSQMAEAFFNLRAPSDVCARSAGQSPAREIWPEVVDVMAEVGVDLSDRRPRRLTREMQLRVDWAVTLACGAQCPYVPTTVEDWAIEDPAGKPLDKVREIREAVDARVRDLLDHRIDAIRSDRTAHQLRLADLLRELGEEFDGIRSESEIRACADAILVGYDEAPVRSFVMTIAARRTRDCLRAERCEVLSAV